jgi:hypothetical protein
MALVVGLLPRSSAEASTPISITASGANGAGRINTPGRSCEDGGDAASWHYAYESSVRPGVFSDLSSEVRVNLDVHGEVEPSTTTGEPTGWLQGTESTAALVNERGTIVLRLADGGGCGNTTAELDRTKVVTAGTWTVDHGSGSYAGATGTGQFGVTAGIAPGADNPWSLQLSGAIEIAQPVLEVAFVRSWWGNLGTDYLTRRPTVLVRVTNRGGDGFGLTVTAAASPTAGVQPLTGVPIRLGDLPAGQSLDLTLRYQLGLLAPCALVIVGCAFGVTVATSVSDALGASAPSSVTVPATAPLLPPPL